MSNVKILFFAADPLSARDDAPALRLRLDEDAREIRQKVRSARHGRRLEFDTHWAVRTDDLLQGLNESHPQVVHFSGHGSEKGLVLVGSDGRSPHSVRPAALVELFRLFSDDICVVVLSACFSLPQATAIAQAVGCAIGTPAAISDAAAITFGASFYRAIAFGESVQAAYEQARTALAMDDHDEAECPQLVVRDDVDARKLFLIAREPPHPANAAPPAFDRRDEPADVSTPALAPVRPRRRVRAPVWTGFAVAMVAGAGAMVNNGGVFGRGGGPSDGAADSVPVVGLLMGAARPAQLHRPDPLSKTASSKASTPKSRPAAPADSSAPITASRAAPAPAARDLDLTAAVALWRAGDYAPAFPALKRLADAGNAQAMGYVGIASLRGRGTQQNDSLGIEVLRKAGSKRDLMAMDTLASEYEKGIAVHPSLRWARHWYGVAANEKHDVGAMRNLARLYRQLPQYDSALIWYWRAAQAGSFDAQVEIAEMYEQGQGGRMDLEEARRLYRSAANAGSVRAMLALGRIYQEGAGVGVDRAAAIRWYRKANDAGSSLAATRLAELGTN